MIRFFTLIFFSLFSLFSAYGADKNYWLEDHTSPEVQEKLDSGIHTIFIPTAGIEQNGQFGTLKKHHHVLRYTLPKIAEIYQNALIAPIIDFVPEGDIKTREGHMAFAGTLSMPRDIFRAIIANSVKSLAAHGFKKFYLLGDSGGNQSDQIYSAKTLRRQGYFVYAIPDYYANNKQNQYLMEKYNLTMKDIGTHMGLRDTSELLCAFPDAVRQDKIVNNKEAQFEDVGANGNATLATAEIGKFLLDIKINAALNQIKEIEDNPPVEKSQWELFKEKFFE